MCLDDQILNTYLDEELVEPWKTQVEEHLSYCTACQKRYTQLDDLHNLISQSRLQEDELENSQNKVLSFIENNYLSQENKVKFWNREFKIKTPFLLSTAAAFLFVLFGTWFIGSGIQTDTDQLIPSVVPATEGSIVQVRATEALAANQVLENFSLEEILKYLDSKGFDVDLRLRAIQLFEENNKNSLANE
jgi:anti-sigma factor RsiW